MELTKIWVTKYALTSGIFEAEAEIEDQYGRMASIPSRRYFTAFHGNDWHRTLTEANKRAEEMRLKKISSLKKQLKKLEELKF